MESAMSVIDRLEVVGRVRALAPKTLAGHRRFRQVVTQDGALPARIKLLFVAATASVKNYVDLATRELRAARDAGLDIDSAGSAIAILASSRGEGAALRFEAIFADVYGADARVDAAEAPIEVGAGEAEANFLKYFGEMPPSLGKLVELVPVGADAYYLMREGTLSGTALAPHHAELLLVSVLAADYSNWASVHMNGARRAGASEPEVAEAVLCAVPVAGLSAWVVGATAMDAGKK
jgi:alkylhydroperoxidase/carboxymuconolactone decarboxylase family protein YurZ